MSRRWQIVTINYVTERPTQVVEIARVSTRQVARRDDHCMKGLPKDWAQWDAIVSRCASRPTIGKPNAYRSTGAHTTAGTDTINEQYHGNKVNANQRSHHSTWLYQDREVKVNWFSQYTCIGPLRRKPYNISYTATWTPQATAVHHRCSRHHVCRASSTAISFLGDRHAKREQTSHETQYPC